MGVSGDAKWYAPYPVYLVSAKGGRVRDLDGRSYVDFLMGAGPDILGHGHSAVRSAIEDQLGRLVQTLAPTTLEAEFAERLREHMPYLERIRFTNTGSEAVRSCLRAARAFTGRSGLAKIEGTYHGSDDPFLLSSASVAGDAACPTPSRESAGVPDSTVGEVLILPPDDHERAVELIHERSSIISAIFLEPFAFSTGGAIPVDAVYVSALRQVADEIGALLVFDEVVTGFRLGLAGAPAYLGVTPDLSAIGKAIGGGLPLAAMGGRAEVMDAVLGEGSASGMRIFQSGTFTGHPLSLAAGLATLDVLEREPVLERIGELGERFRRGLRELLVERGLPASVTGLASIFQLHFRSDPPTSRRQILEGDMELLRLFLLDVVSEGVLWPPIHPGVIGYAHSEDDIDEALEAVGRVADRFAGWGIGSHDPVSVRVEQRSEDQ
jgi:glutamate-1-semialdehyde 2,1-aminomutase